MDLAGNGHAITVLAILLMWAMVAAVMCATDLDQSAGFAGADILNMEWQRITSAPFDRDLELAVLDYDGVHALAFPCRRVLGSWLKAETKHKIDAYPTHWREWQDPG